MGNVLKLSSILCMIWNVNSLNVSEISIFAFGWQDIQKHIRKPFDKDIVKFLECIHKLLDGDVISFRKFSKKFLILVVIWRVPWIIPYKEGQALGKLIYAYCPWFSFRMLIYNINISIGDDIDFYGMLLKGVNLIFLRSFKGISYFKNEVFNCKPSKDGTEITTWG